MYLDVVQVMKFSLFFLLFCVVRAASGQTLTILNWEDYLSEKTIKAWEARSGHQIKQIYFDNDEVRDNVLINHKDNVIDIVIIDEIASRTIGKKGLLLPVSSFSNTPNINGVDSSFQQSCGEYSIPYLWGTFGIAYRTDKIENKPTSWNFLLNPADDVKGHIGLIDDFGDALNQIFNEHPLRITSDQ